MSEPYFEIERLIELVREQAPERLELVKQLEQSVFRKWIRQPYVQFVSDENADGPGSIRESIVIEHPSEGTMVVDVLKDGRIGGIEFVNQISAQQPQWMK